MKTALTFILSFLSTIGINAQSEHQWTDTLFRDNGNIYEIRTMSLIDGDSLVNGPVVSYNIDGIKVSESSYKPADSVPCFNCYEFIADEWVQYNVPKMKYHSLEMGKRVTYHPNGQISSTGIVAGVHEHEELDCEIDTSTRWGTSAICDGLLGTSIIYDGVWKYYNESGDLIREEEYFNGGLVKKETIKYGSGLD